MKEAPELLRKLSQATAEKRLSWSCVEKNQFRAISAGGTVEISGDPAPASLQIKLNETWTGTSWNWLSGWLYAPLEPLKKLLSPEGQSKVSWPARRVSVTSADGLIVINIEFDREHSAYFDASTLLIQATASSEGGEVPKLITAILAALETPATKQIVAK